MNRSGLYLLAGALLAAVLWLKTCHDPAVREAAALASRAAVTDSLRSANRATGDSLTSALAALRKQQIRNTRTRAALSDTAHAALSRVDTLWATLPAVADSVRSALDAIRAGYAVALGADSAVIGSLRVDLADALALVAADSAHRADVDRVTARLVGERDAYAKAAGRRWHLVAGVGVVGSQQGVGPGLFLGLARRF